MAGERRDNRKRSSSLSDYNDNVRSKRRNTGDDRGKISISSDDTVYRYLCPSKHIGSIMGKGGEIVKQLRSESNSKIKIGETVSGCEERVITIYSRSEETNEISGTDRVCPAQDALLKVHDRVADDVAADEESKEAPQVTARLLVPSDQIGHIIGKGGTIIQTIRTDTGAQIRILKDNQLPTCALRSDEVVQISGEASPVRKALFKIATRLHDNPSRSQHLLDSTTTNVYASGAPIMGLTPVVGAYGGYKGESGDWGRSIYPPPRRESSSKEFSLRLICPSVNIGSVIGKGGAIIKQIRQETGATINVDTAATEAEDCVITVSAKEMFEETFSPTIEAAIRLQPRCSERVERDSGRISFTTQLLVRASETGSLIGKRGAIISEIRRISKASIHVVSKEKLPRVAERDEDVVQISGELDFAKEALVQVTSRLRGNIFEREGALSTFVPVLPYLPVAAEVPKYEHRDSKHHERRHSYTGRYDASRDLRPNDRHRSYDRLQGRSNSDAYGGYRHSSYSLRHSGSSGLSRHERSSRRRERDYAY